MKDPERLGTSGSDEDRRLLQSARHLRAPEHLKEQVWRTVQARLQDRPRPLPAPHRRRLAVLAACLVAATAAAAALPVWRAWHRPVPVPAPGPPERATPASRSSQPSPPPSSTPSPTPISARSPARPAPAAPPLAATPQRPSLDLPGYLRGAVDPPSPTSATAPRPAPRLVIARSDRRDIALDANALSVRGSVRGRAVDLTVRGATMSGRIGGDEVNVHFLGDRRAEGSIGGLPVAFVFTPTEHGWIVGTSLPELSGRVSLDSSRLLFLPGCERDLPAVANRPGVYEGTCSDRTRLRLELPAAFLEMPAQPRLAVLGMLFLEPDPELRDRVRGLFAPGP